MKKIGVLGSGQVGEVLANGFLKHGYAVMRGSREPEKMAVWSTAAGEHASVGTVQEAASFGELIVLAVKGSAAEAAVTLASDALSGKTVIDATNPIDSAPPENGVLRYFTGPNESLMERLQKQTPSAHFVKAFSCVGNAYFVNPDFGGVKPTMFICVDNAEAKKEVSTVLDQFGWEVEDSGLATSARAIEPLCILWCLPGFRENRWTHAFKLLKR